MGQVFTEWVDKSLLEEGTECVVRKWDGDEWQTIHGFLHLNVDVWAVQDDGNKDLFWWACWDNGRLCSRVEYVDIVNASDADPAEKMQAEHADMLTLLEDIDSWKINDVHSAVSDFLEYRKAQQ